MRRDPNTLEAGALAHSASPLSGKVPLLAVAEIETEQRYAEACSPARDRERRS